ncbi:MAG: nicotinamide-nucleotide amidohydrolase family protein, partial [Gemmatimonadota bacterium]
GVVIDDDDLGLTVLLPGVPTEMRGLMGSHVVPLLRERLGPLHAVQLRVIRTTGIAESIIAGLIDDIAADVAPLTLAFLPHLAGVDLRLAAWTDESAAALDRVHQRLAERLGPYVYARDETDLAFVVGHVLRSRRLTLALAESCTGGLLSKRLSDEPGASAFLRAAFVTYANAAKRDLIAVTVQTLAMHGAVSERCAREMADGARRMADADVGVSITGVAGPGGGSEAKPVGTVWVAVSHRAATRAKLLRLAGNRMEIRERAAQAALDMLRRTLTGLSDGP